MQPASRNVFLGRWSRCYIVYKSLLRVKKILGYIDAKSFVYSSRFVRVILHQEFSNVCSLESCQDRRNLQDSTEIKALMFPNVLPYSINKERTFRIAAH